MRVVVDEGCRSELRGVFGKGQRIVFLVWMGVGLNIARYEVFPFAVDDFRFPNICRQIVPDINDAIPVYPDIRRVPSAQM